MKLARLVAASLFLFAAAGAIASDPSYQWQRRVAGSGLGNPLTVNPLNPSTVFSAIGNQGAIVVSRDGGTSWSTLALVPGGGSIKAVCVSPLDTLVLLAGQERSGVADRVVRSTDGGTNWTETLAGEFSYFGVPIEFSEAHPDTVYTMMGTAFYRSTDFGATWAMRNGSPGFNTWCDAAVRPDSAGVLYVGDASSGIWKTTDGGATFHLVYATPGEIPMIAIDPVDPAVAYATKFNGPGSGVVKTTDFGESWQEVADFQAFTQCWGIAVDRTDHNRVVMGTYSADPARSGIYLSSDAGATWMRTSCGLHLPVSVNYGLLVLDSTRIFSLQDDGVYALGRIDLGGYLRASLHGVVYDSATGFPVTADVRLTQSICGSDSVIEQQTDPTGWFHFDGLHVSGGELNATYRIDVDPAIPYAQVSLSDVPCLPDGHPVSVPVASADIFVAGADSGGHAPYVLGILSSLGLRTAFWNTAYSGPAPLARGTEFTTKTVLYYAAGRTTPLTQAEDSALVACLDAGCGLIMAGQDLLERNPSAAIFTSKLRVGFSGNASIVYNEGTPGGILDSLNFFTNSNGADYPQSRDIMTATDSLTIPILGYGAGGATGVAGVRREFASNRAVFLGFGLETVNPTVKRETLIRRLFQYVTGTLAVGGRSEELPQAIRLEQNFPNPFNPSTMVSFTLPERMTVRLEVYDMLGRLVARLADGESFDAGEHRVSFRGEGLPSGVYACRLSAGGGSSTVARTRMMLLMR
jgi:photosystem II stability/assembly factor-like uncharacterized protein